MRRLPTTVGALLAALLLALLPLSAGAADDEWVTVSGTLRYSWGEPVPGYDFTLVANGATYGGGRTDARGAFVTQIGRGTYEIHPSGWADTSGPLRPAPYFYSTDEATPGTLTITGPMTNVVVTLRQPPVYGGTVTWKGRPISGARVSVIAKPSERSRWNTLATVASSADGTYEARLTVDDILVWGAGRPNALRPSQAPWILEAEDCGLDRNVIEGSASVSYPGVCHGRFETTYAPDRTTSATATRLPHADDVVYTSDIAVRLVPQVGVAAEAHRPASKKQAAKSWLRVTAQVGVRHPAWTGGRPRGKFVFTSQGRRLGQVAAPKGVAKLVLRGTKSRRITGRIEARFIPSDRSLAPAVQSTKKIRRR